MLFGKFLFGIGVIILVGVGWGIFKDVFGIKCFYKYFIKK